jgi:hypothetical protein
MVLSLMNSNITLGAAIHRHVLQRVRKALDRIDRERRYPNRIETYYLLNVMRDVAGGRFAAIEDSMSRAEAALNATPDQILRFTYSCPKVSMEAMRSQLNTLVDEQRR